ncbi:MAG: alpha/beta fold hydrolase [Nitrospirales bacterium]
MKTVIDGITVGYTDQGNGTPLVFIHAFPLSKTMWQPQVDALKDTHRVITIDLGGHGESNIVLWNDSLDGYAKNVIRLLDHLEIAQAVFVGLSMGGYTLFSIYRHYADRVKALVLADTRAQADTEEGKAGRQSMAEVAFKDSASAIADLMLPKLLAPATIEQRPEIVEQVRQMILQTSTAGIVVDLVAMAARPDSTDLLSTITCPTLVIVGEDDQATPVAESQYIAQRIPGSTFVTIPQAGHLSNFEQPAAFNQALRSFLKKCCL